MHLDVIICTYNHAAALDRVLTRLGEQEGAQDVEWDVLVVDNNCTDATPAVLVRHGVRAVREPEQGLTPARLRGLTATRGEWLAYVDDDCLVARDWIAEAAAAIARRPEAGGLGGEVVLVWDREPPAHARRAGWAFAEQRRGDEPHAVESLAGAGMILRRAAVERSGWPQGPLLADRVGRRLVSGGDVELSLRVGAVAPLYYEPALRLEHLIPADRAEPRALARLVFGLGISQQLAQGLAAPDRATWRRGRPSAARALLRPSWWALRRREGADALLAVTFLAGWLLGATRVRHTGVTSQGSPS